MPTPNETQQWVRLKGLLDTDPYATRQKFIGYTPDLNTMTVPASVSGYFNDQVLKTESLAWNPALTADRKVCLIACSEPEARLTLRGKIGYENGPGLIQSVAEKLYSSSSAHACAMTKDLYKFFNPEYETFHNKTIIDECWLANSFLDNGHYGLYHVFADFLSVEYLFHSSGSTCFADYHVWPLVLFDTDILVNIGDPYYDGSSQERPLKIRVASLPPRQQRSIHDKVFPEVVELLELFQYQLGQVSASASKLFQSCGIKAQISKARAQEEKK